MARYDESLPTLTSGQNAEIQLDVNGRQLVSASAGTYSYRHISTATTTVVKSGAGGLHSVVVNTLGTVASTTTIYDNTTGSGTVIGVINTLTLAGVFVYDVAFTVGLTVVTTGTVAPDLTVSYQ